MGANLSAEKVLIADDATIADAFEFLNENKLGVVFVRNKNGVVIGALSDGDIRRSLLKNSSLKQSVGSCCNREFVRVCEDTAREKILKLFDARISVVPVLDSDGRLVRILSRGNFHVDDEEETCALAKAPVRITFGGGGTDLTHYFSKHGGAVINATIKIYAHAALKRHADQTIKIYSHDFGAVVEAENLDALEFDGDLDLIKAVVRTLKPEFGFELHVGSDFPVGSGLGGSATVAAAIIACFNEFRRDRWTRHQIAEVAFQAERLLLNIGGGWQDQYASVFGGINFMEFDAETNEITPLRLDDYLMRTLEANLILCYTGKGHSSGDIHADQKARFQADKSGGLEEKAARHRQITYEMKRFLLRGDLDDFGRLLDEAWRLKRQFSPLIACEDFDRLYDVAMNAGALGGKLMGAGGGGYFLFYVRPFDKYRVINALQAEGLSVSSPAFDEKGVQSWMMRNRDE